MRQQSCKETGIDQLLLVFPMPAVVIIGIAVAVFGIDLSHTESKKYAHMVKLYPDGDVIKNLVLGIELPRKMICGEDTVFTQYWYDTKSGALFCEHTWARPDTATGVLLIGILIFIGGMVGGILALCIYWKTHPDMYIPLSALSLMYAGRLRWTVVDDELYRVTSLEPMQPGDAANMVRTHNVQSAELLKITGVRSAIMRASAVQVKCVTENQCFDMENRHTMLLFLPLADLEYQEVSMFLSSKFDCEIF